MFGIEADSILPMRRMPLRTATFVGCLMVPGLAGAQQPLQFNVPYSCQDGVTRVINRCEKNARGGEVCFWREEQNGQLIGERYNVRGQMDGWLATCKAQPAQPAPTARPAVPSVAPPPTPATRAVPPAAGAASAPTMANDPGTVAMRRCLELGGGTAECLGNGLQTGLLDLAGLGGNPLANVVTNGVNPSGVRIGGTFTAADGLTIEFNNQTATISKCGKLLSDGREYTVTKRGNQLQVEIPNEPKPLVVQLGANNVFTGPAAFPITGQVITGYRSVYVEQRRVIDNLPVPGSGHYEQVPNYETRTLNCGFASLRATGPTRPDGGVVGAISGIFTGKPDPSSALSGTTEAPAGPRMGGTYAGPSGFKVEFQATAVVLDCGNAHVKRPYDVKNLTDRVVVTVRNGSVPMTLTVGPDGALTGSGSVDVAGRLVTGINGSDVTFAPHQERCVLGTLTVQNQ